MRDEFRLTEQYLVYCHQPLEIRISKFNLRGVKHELASSLFFGLISGIFGTCDSEIERVIGTLAYNSVTSSECTTNQDRYTVAFPII